MTEGLPIFVWLIVCPYKLYRRYSASLKNKKRSLKKLLLLGINHYPKWNLFGRQCRLDVPSTFDPKSVLC